MVVSFVLLFLLVLSAAFVYGQLSSFREWLRVKTTPTMTTESASVGAVDLEGTGQTVGEPIESPTMGECLCVFWAITTSKDWDKERAYIRSDPFLLEDDTGEILVEDPARPFPHDTSETEHAPLLQSGGSSDGGKRLYKVVYVSEDDTGQTHEAVIHVPDGNKTTTVVPPGEKPPGALSKWCTQQGIDPVADEKRWFHQVAVHNESTIYVHGEAVRAEDRPDTTDSDLLVRSNNARQKFLLAEGSEAELQR